MWHMYQPDRSANPVVIKSKLRFQLRRSSGQVVVVQEQALYANITRSENSSIACAACVACVHRLSAYTTSRE
jgi:hypothetical protein